MIKKGTITSLALIAFLSFLVIFQSYWVQWEFLKHSLPVYDGVMYEKQQILRFLAFKGNFSPIERYNQFIYELTGNPVSGGFTSLTCLINPKWLENGSNIYVRSFFAMLVFLGALYLWLRNRVKTIFLFIILFLTTQLPIFYHFRFGLGSYVPDVPAALNLISSYMLSLLVLEKKINFKWLFFVPLLLTIAFFSRYNFYAYSVLLFVVLIPSIVKFIRNERLTKERLFFILVFVGFLLIWISYGVLHFESFINYCAKPAEYQKVNLGTSLSDFWDYLISIHGWTSLLVVCFMAGCFVIGKTENYDKEKSVRRLFLSCYPAIVLFLFLYFTLNATNQPHVNSAFCVVLLVAVLGLFDSIKWRLPVENKFFFGGYLVVILGVLGWFYMERLDSFSKTDKGTELNMRLFRYIEKEWPQKPRYFFTHDTQLEIPFDVAYFRKNHVWLDNKLKFYFTDWNFYDIDPALDRDNITSYYLKEIELIKPQIITFPIVDTKEFGKNKLTIEVRRNLKLSLPQIGYLKAKHRRISNNLEVFEYTR
jgi:hypothetical protein